LSFDFMNNTYDPVGHPVHVAGGSPRISVDIDEDGNGTYDGNSAFLAAAHCEEPTSDPLWSRADFTGRITSGCTLQYKLVDYASDGAKSAWTVFAEAFPAAKVKDAYMVFDEDGTSFVDRLAVHNRMWTTSGTSTSAIKTCSSEPVC